MHSTTIGPVVEEKVYTIPQPRRMEVRQFDNLAEVRRYVDLCRDAINANRAVGNEAIALTFTLVLANVMRQRDVMIDRLYHELTVLGDWGDRNAEKASYQVQIAQRRLLRLDARKVGLV